MMYKTLLLFLIFNMSLKTWGEDHSNNYPPAVLEAKQDVVSISSDYGAGSGFIVRDNENKAILVTAYHVIRESMNALDRIKVKTIDKKRLKIKKILSYSVMLDTVFLELKDYDGKGLKFATLSSDTYEERVFVLGVPFTKDIHYVDGMGFNNPSKKTLNVITTQQSGGG